MQCELFMRMDGLSGLKKKPAGYVSRFRIIVMESSSLFLFENIHPEVLQTFHRIIVTVAEVVVEQCVF